MRASVLRRKRSCVNCVARSNDFVWNVRFLKNPGLLCERIELRYAFIADHQQIWPVSVQCDILQLSRSGFYGYLSRQARPAIDAEEVTSQD